MPAGFQDVELNQDTGIRQQAMAGNQRLIEQGGGLSYLGKEAEKSTDAERAAFYSTKMMQDKADYMESKGIATEERKAKSAEGILGEQREYDLTEEERQRGILADETTPEGKKLKGELDYKQAQTELAKANARKADRSPSTKALKDEVGSELYTDAEGKPLKERTVKQLTNEWKQQLLDDEDANGLINAIQSQIETELGKVDVEGIDIFEEWRSGKVTKAEQEIISRYQGAIDAVKAKVDPLDVFIQKRTGAKGSTPAPTGKTQFTFTKK